MRDAGFSLMELMVALLISVTTVLGFASGVLNVMKANRASEQQSQAAALAQERLALLKEAASAGAAPTAGGPVTEEDFQIQWTVPGAGPQPGTWIVQVQVSWTDSQPHTLRFETIVREG